MSVLDQYYNGLTLPQPDYARAFSQAFTTIWGNTPFSSEAYNLSYFRAMTCFLSKEEEDIIDRRHMMFQYLANDFGHSKVDDTLIQLYNLIPVEEGITRILRNLCTLYSQSPNRTFDSKNISEVYTDSGIDNAFKQAHRLGKLCNTVLVMPVVRDEKIEIDVFPPDLFRVKTDAKDFKKITELWIPISTVGSDGVSVYTFKVWSNDTYRVIDSEGDEISTEPNIYGVIPAVILQFENSRTNFYGGGLWELVLATLDDNKLCFLANNDVVYSAFSVWIATNFGKTDVRISPNRVLQFSNVQQGDGFDVPPALESVSAAGVFGQIEEFRDARRRKAQRDAGLPESLVSANPGLAPSGVALQIDRQELLQIRREDISVMTRFEQDFYRIFAVVVNKDLGLGLPEKSKVVIDYIEQGEFIEPDARQAVTDGKFTKGVIGAKDYLANFTQNETIKDDNDAIEYMLTNLKNLERLKIDTGTETQVPEQSESGVVLT